MSINYCLPIITNTKEQVVQIIQENNKHYEYFEVWLDYIADLDNDFVIHLATMLGDKLIVLFRRQRLEKPHMDSETRQNLLHLISTTNVYIDLDIATQEEDIAYINEHNLQLSLIASYHNYDKTPGQSELDKFVSKMDQYKPTVYKFATFCENEADAVRLLQLLINLKNKQKQHIILGMGEYGMITRIFGTMWGNMMIFAPQTQEKQTAPGQLTREQLEKIFTIMNIPN